MFHRFSPLLSSRERLEYGLVSWLFIKLLALVYIAAFASFAVQVPGLIGSHGIQPAALYLQRVSEGLGGSAYRLVPTLLWLGSSDRFLQGACVAGIFWGCLALFGVLWRAALVGAFALYLSLVSVSQEFLSYQWDFLLLEAGFLAIFTGYSQIIIWLFRWLLFRLMFLSGAVKLFSGDPTWRSLTALTFHYQTQPLPTPLAWYAQQLPVWFQKASCLGVFIIELGFALLILGPRRARLIALPPLLALQVLIALTGNYAFFNLLAMSLCVFLLDDEALARILPHRIRTRKVVSEGRVQGALAGSMALLVSVLSVAQITEQYFGVLPASAKTVVSLAAPYGISNSYGLFAVMTTRRPEIVVEGSRDGVEWHAYGFQYKPGELQQRPGWVAPRQPRLDWQMWFAALGSYRENIWFVNFLARLLQGSPEVLALLGNNPFPGQPPKYVRALLFDYSFTDYRQTSGDWWIRRPGGTYLRAVSLEDLSDLPILRGGS
ncbi:MAG TPA: lipase maturation factor family protein [Bryobacteraceae bacterium]|nr:lipase maturation factor family protein [Bryobacteraceae bacterium]